MPRRSLLPAVACLLGAAALFAQVTERIDVSAIEVPVVVRDARGTTPTDLKPSDFQLLEDGVPQEIIGLALPEHPAAGTAGAAKTPATQSSQPAEKRWQIVIYLQQSLTSTHALKASLEGLVPHAEELTALGDVEIVGDEGALPHVIVPATHDAATLRQALLDLAPKIRGTQDVVRLRLNYLQEKESDARMPDAAKDQRARATAQMEAMMIRARQESMLTWLGRYGMTTRPRAAVVVTTGFDTDFSAFYEAINSDTAATIRSLSAAPRQQEISEAMAAQGWTIISFAPEWLETQSNPTFDAATSGHGRLDAFKGKKPAPAGPSSINYHPLDALRQMAEATGGSVQVDAAKFGDDLSDLTNRVVLTYQLHRPRDGRTHHITVKALRPGLTVRAQRAVVSGTPEALSVARATVLSGNEGERGELPVRCTYRDTAKGDKEATAELEALVSLVPINAVRAGLTSATLRFSIAVASPDAPPFTISKRMENLDLSKQAGWQVTFQVRHRPGARMGLVAEEISTGAWGGCTCTDAANAPVPAPVESIESSTPEPPSTMSWMPLDRALQEAKKSGKLILLEILTGEPKRDAGRKKWMAEAEARDSIAQSMRQMVLARDTVRGSVISSIPSVAPIARTPVPRLLVLDPGGALVIEPENGFDDSGEFAIELNLLRQQTATFARAAALRERGDVAQSLVTRAEGLLGAGMIGDAAAAFKEAADFAEKAHDDAVKQEAQLGIASIDLRGDRLSKNQGIALLEEVTRKPVNSSIAASAWLLLGHIHRELHETGAATKAYQNAYRAADKPSTLATAAKRFLEMLGSEPEGELRAAVAAGEVHLIYPRRDVVVGSADFVAAAPPGAARVDFFLDEARVAESSAAPFRARIALGSTPRPHTIRAVAFDAAGAQLGEDSATINDAGQSLGVTIVAPREDAVESRTVVEVQPRVPEGRRVAGVDLYWNETKIATLTAPPYRSALTLPSANAAGYIRAVLRDDSGATAEDVKMLNSGVAAETVRVDAVQLYAIAQDRRGHYVEGLTPDDFAVKEDGRQVPVHISSSANDPISVGLALDTSASMQISMLEVIEYANEFVKTSLAAGDQTFVVAFDERPRLVQPLTADRQLATSSLYDMNANGRTAIWDALLFSLQQFRNVQGKRALVLFTDGHNTAGTVPRSAPLQYAREVGVPVYVVLIFTGQVPSAPVLGQGPATVSPDPGFDERTLQELAESTGGAFFRFARKKDLPRLFAQIRDDTRGEYLLTYVSPSTKPPGELRRISVSVRKPGVSVRATSGYYPR